MNNPIKVAVTEPEYVKAVAGSGYPIGKYNGYVWGE